MVNSLLLKGALVPLTCRNFIFSKVALTDPGKTPRSFLSCMLDTGCHRFHFRHILPWQHRPTAASQYKAAFFVRWLGSGVGAVIDRYLFSISWWKLAEALLAWLQWSSKDWGRAIRRTPGLPFWISGLIVLKTCAGEASHTTQKHRNNQQSLKGTH